jgi:hypothetical protein
MKYIIVDGLWIRKFDSKTIITKIKKKLTDFDEIITKIKKKLMVSVRAKMVSNWDFFVQFVHAKN